MPGSRERLDVRRGVAAASRLAALDLAAAVAHEDQLVALLERRHVRDVAGADAPAREEADVRERVEVRRVIVFVSIPPIERPAIARCG
jgi:hypothetical protein